MDIDIFTLAFMQTSSTPMQMIIIEFVSPILTYHTSAMSTIHNMPLLCALKLGYGQLKYASSN